MGVKDGEWDPVTVTRVQVCLLSSVRRMAGWSTREIAFEGRTLDGLLRSIPAGEGKGTLFDRLTGNGCLRGDYVVMINDRPVRDLATVLADGDRLVTIEVFGSITGGS